MTLAIVMLAVDTKGVSALAASSLARVVRGEAAQKEVKPGLFRSVVSLLAGRE